MPQLISDADSTSELVGIALYHRTGPFHLPILDPLNRIPVTANLPAALGVGTILEAHLVAVDAPDPGVILSLDRSIGLIELRVGTGRDHRALHRIAAHHRTDLITRQHFGRPRSAAVHQERCQK